VIAPVALAALLSSCAPSVAPDTMSAIIEVESGRNPYAIYDDTTRVSYTPSDGRIAFGLALALLRRGHNLDVGIGQVNSANFPIARLSEMLKPCPNLRLASSILAGDYAQSQRALVEPVAALRGALGAYNTGDIHSGAAYVSRVVAAASVPSIAILTGQPSPTPSARPTAAPKPRPTSTPGPWHSQFGSP
jgi:type IV secretion system protein VirB1